MQLLDCFYVPLAHLVLDVQEDGFEGVELEGEGREEVLPHVEPGKSLFDDLRFSLSRVPVYLVEITDDDNGDLLGHGVILVGLVRFESNLNQSIAEILAGNEAFIDLVVDDLLVSGCN
jgi:hypothetical protein